VTELTTRFAPAPTGHLHLGHVVNAICVWGVAEQAEGRVLLRMEDHDRQRSRAEYERSILDDLQWLGFLDRGAVPVARQSERVPRYESVLAQLQQAGLVYACDCSRRELASDQSPEPGLELRYPGRCRDRNLEWSPGRGLRVRLEDSVERFEDLLLGHQEQRPQEECGDLLIRDRLGNWTYQFCVTVDDFDQGVTMVIRGEDLLASTGRQLALARLIGRTDPPLFLHHPLIRRPDGAKLSKSSGDTGVGELRAAGLSPEDVIARATHAVPSGLQLPHPVHPPAAPLPPSAPSPPTPGSSPAG
jgi:glutamyl-tRNA synthetase/glutamyl-Q tRNA(Asp) synthetase